MSDKTTDSSPKHKSEDATENTAPAAWSNTAVAQIWEGNAAGADETTLSLRRIRRILNDSRDTSERLDAAQKLMPHLWDRLPWRRYQAGCVLTTRVYLPSTLYLMEWGSFPNVLTRELRRFRYHKLPETVLGQRTALSKTLGNMLSRWTHRQTGGVRSRERAPNINMDVAADVCEAIGRLGFTEAEQDLLEIIRRFHADNNQVRTAALLALAALPPEQLRLTWEWLRAGSPQEQRLVAAALAYMTLPQAVPYLLEAFPGIVGDAANHHSLGIPLLLALGRIGDPRALPDLNRLARRGGHPLQPTARKAIQRIMKEAEGHEEVTLVRASGISTLYEDVLLRPSDEKESDMRPEQLLRPTATENAPPTASRPPKNADIADLPEAALPDTQTADRLAVAQEAARLEGVEP